MQLLKKLKKSPSKEILGLELFLLFFFLPILLATSVASIIKISCVVLALLYVLLVGVSKHSFKKVNIPRPSIAYLVRVIGLSILLFIIGFFVMKTTRPEALFNMPKNNIKFWIQILMIYAFFSVFTQELLYRRYFFNRYQSLIQNKNLLFFINVICFSLCHIFLHTTWVLIATAIGGALFAYTYKKEKSLFWTCVEHALYGNILFSIGIGAELAFPAAS